MVSCKYFKSHPKASFDDLLGLEGYKADFTGFTLIVLYMFSLKQNKA